LTLLNDPRFAELFDDDEFVIDENSWEFAAFNPVRPESKRPKGLTAVDEEMRDKEDNEMLSSDEDEDSSLLSAEETPVSAPKLQKASKPSTDRRQATQQPGLTIVSSSTAKQVGHSKIKSFGSRLARIQRNPGKQAQSKDVGSKHQISFIPEGDGTSRKATGTAKRNIRRSASGNVFRRM
jgi:ribosome biogenesis protein ENP2